MSLSQTKDAMHPTSTLPKPGTVTQPTYAFVILSEAKDLNCRHACYHNVNHRTPLTTSSHQSPITSHLLTGNAKDPFCYPSKVKSPGLSTLIPFTSSRKGVQ